MRVQLNRQDEGPHHDHKFDVTAYDLPVNPAATRTLSPVVAVLGRPGRVAGLRTHLPTGWSLRDARDVDDVRAGELVLMIQPTRRDVETARAVLPRRAPIVAMVDEHASAELVAAVLTAGADACVRGGHLAILASHLVACRRRLLADRWSELHAAATGQA